MSGNYIPADRPIHDAIFFNFGFYTDVLKEIITGEETPPVIGIFGDQGSGKTCLMKTLEQKIKKDGESSSAHTIWFNALICKKEDAIRHALMMRILEELKTGGTRGNKEALDLEEFQFNFERMINDNYVAKKKKAVIFIDGLSSCIPEQAIEVLEAVKLFLDVKGCIFVIAIDRNVIHEGIRVKYRDFLLKGAELQISGDEYLEKIVQFGFTLPSITDDKLKDFINYYDPGNSFKKYQEFIIKGTGRNPRKIKRFINSIEFERKLAEVIPEFKFIKDELKQNFDALLIEWQIIRSSSDKEFAEFCKQVLKNNKLLFDMHNYLESRMQEEPSEMLRPFLKESLQGLIEAFPEKGKLTEELIEKVIHYSSVTSARKIEIKEAEPKKSLTPGEVRKAMENGESLGGAILCNADLEGFDLGGMNLSRADLGGANLSSTNLNTANLSGANLARADLTGADLTGANLAGANLSRFALSVVKKLEGASLPGLELSKTDFTGSDLSLSNLSGANLSGANLYMTNLYRANLSRVKFSGANISGTNLFEADLSDADLSNRDLCRVDFTGAKLTRANLSNSKLLNANLTYADLSSANLAGADLSGSRLLKANLTDADLSYASLNEAHLLSAILNGANLSNATFIGTITPSVEVNEKTKAEHMRIVKEEIKEVYLFNWDNIPGDDSGELMEFLNRYFNIEWVKTATIEKIDSGRTIKVSAEKNSLSLKLNDEKTRVNLKIDDVKADEFIAKMEDTELNIYQEDFIFKSNVKQALDCISGNLRKIICRDNASLHSIYESLDR
ncbi:MAG TPA: pentapeptide repeat-containing protein [Candidatus Methanoperedens sp.]